MGIGVHRAGRPDQRVLKTPVFESRTGLHHDRLPFQDQSPFQGQGCHAPYNNPGSSFHGHQVLLMQLGRLLYLILLLLMPLF